MACMRFPETAALLFSLCVAVALMPQLAEGKTRHYTFNIQYRNVTRLCSSRKIITVNGKFPGPRLVAREDDHVLVRVNNHIKENVSIHWHGVRQLRSGWADGPAYITQCPIQSGHSYTYNFTIIGQRGTLWYHAHISWLRATLYGPIILLPRKNESYPFVKPYKEIPIILGEWFKANPEAVISQALQTGGGPNVSDAYTLNGLPGPTYNCSSNDVFKLKVKPGKTYLLRLINAALNDELFYGVANHSLTVVCADATYVKPFTTDIVVITPGQTMAVLLKTKPTFPNATFLMLTSPYFTGSGTLDNTSAAAILEYEHPLGHYDTSSHIQSLPLLKPSLPPFNGTKYTNVTQFVQNLARKFRSLNSPKYPAKVPQTVDRKFFFTVGLGTSPCPKNTTCQGPNGQRFSAEINNMSFTLPSVAMLQSHFFAQSNVTYRTDFPSKPLVQFNYTGTPPNNTHVTNSTRAVVIPYNTSVELVLQDTSILGVESHPLHLHGFNFYVVGQGFGNFDQNKDPAEFNLVDPVERNTVAIPAGGWAAIRFMADNPGVWFMHCHLEIHTSWGLKMAWIVQDGPEPNQKLPPPPADLPQC